METTLNARPGHAILAMKPAYGDFEGEFFIPKSAKSRTTAGRMGLVVSLTLFPENEMSLVYVKGKLKAMPMYVNNEAYGELFEKYVLCRNAHLIFGQMYDVRLEHVQGIVPEDALPSEDELGRCRECMSDGECNILLGPDGFCPICGMNKFGIHEADDELDITEDDIDFLVRNPAEVDHVMRTGGKALKDTIYSFPGQNNRSAMEVARLNELNKVMKGRTKK